MSSAHVVSGSGLSGLLGRPRRTTTYLVGAALFIMVLFYMLLSLQPCMVRGVCYHGYQSPWSFDADKAHNPGWMDDVPDSVPLSSLSIPGTHDTMTYSIGSENLECQIRNLTVQLHAGMRYFDIRARLEGDQLQIYHGNGFTGYGYADVLIYMFDFLDQNPSEAIIMRLKEEGPPIGDKNTITFEEAFNRYRNEDNRTASRAAEHLYIYDRKTPLPTLGELRSKVFILQEFKATGEYGLEWNGPQMRLEDYWIIPNLKGLREKWKAIREALELASTTKHDNSVLYLAHISASVGVLPIEAAAGTRNGSVTGMNDLTGHWLEEFEGRAENTRTGIVIIDFPGRKLVNAVLRWNRKASKYAR